MGKKIFALIILVSGIYSGTSLAATEWIRNASIVRTLSDDISYAGCMIQVNVAATAVDCPGNWYHLNCSIDKDYGKRSYATALMAFSMNAKVHLLVDDSNKVNTYCHARRIDVTR